jgi:hypothetical protein
VNDAYPAQARLVLTRMHTIIGVTGWSFDRSRLEYRSENGS